jgi:hypothetical protein
VNRFETTAEGQNQRIAVTGTQYKAESDGQHKKLIVSLFLGRKPEAIVADFMPVMPDCVMSEQVFKRVITEKIPPDFQYLYELDAASYPLASAREEAMGTNGVEFSFDEMFGKDGWALIMIDAVQAQRTINLSLDYRWDDLKIMTSR